MPKAQLNVPGRILANSHQARAVNGAFGEQMARHSGLLLQWERGETVDFSEAAGQMLTSR